MCPECGLGRTCAKTVSADEQNYLSSEEVGGAERPGYFNMLFDAYCAKEVPGRALDVGCGRGEWVRLLNTRGWTAHGIDTSSQFKPDNVKFFRTAIDDYFPKTLYDLITAVHCFEHVTDPVRSLQHMARMLAPNGRLLIIVPNFGGAWSRLYGADWHMLRTEHHAFHYTPESLERLLQSCGYEIRRTSTCSYYAPSIIELRLSRIHFYERGIGSLFPLRPLLVRANAMLRLVLNKRLDEALDGAEIQILATAGVQPR